MTMKAVLVMIPVGDDIVRIREGPWKTPSENILSFFSATTYRYNIPKYI